MPEGLPFRLDDYMELVDYTGRIMQDDKRGYIANSTPPILDRLDIEPKHWLFMTQNFESRFKGLVGTLYSVKKTFKAFGYLRTPSLKLYQKLFTSHHIAMGRQRAHYGAIANPV